MLTHNQTSERENMILEEYLKVWCKQEKWLCLITPEEMLANTLKRWMTDNIYLRGIEIPEKIRRDTKVCLYVPYSNTESRKVEWVKYSTCGTRLGFTAGYLNGEILAFYASWYPMISNGQKYDLMGNKKK